MCKRRPAVNHGSLVPLLKSTPISLLNPRPFSFPSKYLQSLLAGGDKGLARTSPMAGKRTHFLLFIFFSSLLFHKVFAQKTSNEKQILLNIKNDWGNPLSLSSWNLTGDHCEFAGIHCSGEGFVDVISLYDSDISFPIPASICDLKGLTFLDLSDNNIPGEFPTVLYNCSNLQELDISQNYFVGELPADIDKMPSNLTHLVISGNKFTGDIPPAIGRLPNLEHLDLAMNSLVGEIPAGVWMIKPLKYLYLFANKLTGEISRTVGADGLLEIDLSINKLNGSIPEAFGELKDLTILFLYFNNLSGEIPTSIGRLSNLYDIRLFNNRLEGVLPPEMGKYSKLWNFEVDDNLFTGELPEHLCYGKALTCLIVFDNQLTGKLPESLGNCDTLLNVQIQNNRFTGEFPAGIWSAINLSLVITSQNDITGTLPDKFPLNLTWLEIRHNQFSGGIPSSAGRLSVFLGDNNKFSGELPKSFFDMSSLQRLSLSRNQISGEIPAGIGSVESLTLLDLSNNQLSGQIPDTMGSMILTSLDLSNNQLSGEIPSNLGDLKLGPLNLSNNQLSGVIPVPFQNQAYEHSFLANPNLCTTSHFTSSIQICKNHSKKLSTALLVLFSILGALIFSCVILLCFLITKERRRRKKAGAFQPDWKLTPFQPIDFNENAIVSRLTDDNLVGSGGGGKVYRVSLNLDSTVAVKKIHSTAKLDSNIEKQFQAEVKILGSLRHANIVNLLCCISGENSKLLVYEYLQNGSLDRWLHDRRRGSLAPLDFPTRLRIAVGAAEGLCYMHHHCSPPIIHRDVKSSNILLDPNFNAKIADFGLARILQREGEPESVSAVAGSFGYMAPECSALRKVNEKVDVYSFGVVLLELVTGREAGDGGEEEDENLTDWAWRRHRESGVAVDQEIAGPSPEMMFMIGLICTVSNPALRPTMKEVVQMLLKLSRSSSIAAGDGGALALESKSKMGSRRKQIVDVMDDSDDSVAASGNIVFESM